MQAGDCMGRVLQSKILSCIPQQHWAGALQRKAATATEALRTWDLPHTGEGAGSADLDRL